MKKFLPIHVLCFIFLAQGTFAQDQSSLLRYPALSSDGSQIAFSFQGDIWSAPTAGGTPVRLTIHPGYESYPKWSPDNGNIVFSSDRYGNDDLYVIPAQGGMPQRLTYHSEDDIPTDWTKNNEIIFETNRTFKQIERESELHKIAASGGTPDLFLDALGFDAVLSPNGNFIAFVRGTCRLVREAYQGPANRDIWLYDIQNDTFTQLTDFEGQDVQVEWGDDQTLYYLSASSGKYNIFKLTLDGDGKPGAAEQVTNFTDEGIRYFDVSADGSTLAMEKGTDIYTLPTQGNAEPKPLQIFISADYRTDPIEYKAFTDNLSDYTISPNGKLMAMVVRGELFVKEINKEKNRTVRITDSPSREMNPVWLNDSAIIFVSDREGQYDLYLAQSSDADEHNLYKSLKHEVTRITKTDDDEQNPVISPDHSKIAYVRGNGTLVVAEISATGKLSAEKILLDGWATPSGVSWSPDSKWLAYSLENLDFNEDVYIHAADNSQEPVNVSMHPKADGNPVWSADGSKLGFISSRNNGDADVWFVWLKKEDWEKTMQDWEDTEEPEKEAKNEKEKNKSKKAAEVQIDFEDIYQRLSQVTALPGNESNLVISKDGETFYFVTNRNGRQEYKADQDLYKIKWDATEMKALTSGGKSPYSITLGNDGKYLYAARRPGTLVRYNAEKGDAESLPFSAKMEIDHPAEREQVFEEAWRALNDNFYDPDFHGNDWTELKDKYKAWAMSASTDRDFHDIFNEMLGQLNSSHMGLYGAGDAETQNEETGFLGVAIEPMQKGVKVKHVIPNSPADKEFSKLAQNDIILSIDGEPVSLSQNFYAPLVNKANEEIILEVQKENGVKDEVIIRPTSSLSTLLYEEWVKERKKLTAAYSNNRLGYIHIRGMNWTSFEEFERELTAAGLNKDGIVVDVRYNGGGWTTDYLMAVLNVKQHAYTIPRGAADHLEPEQNKFTSHYPFGERLPLASWTGPSIALCNESSYSNAEIFSHAYKHLGIGTLVGQPTFGAVISTGGKGLIDGSYVRIPFRAWYVLATKTGMEGHPAEPDIVVENTPDSKAKGKDEQLQKAVQVLLDQIDSSSSSNK